MVRTSGGIKISSGKSSKKGGGGGSSSSSRGTSASSTSTKGSSRLPPIPHQETPSWQKPITNFFHSGPSSSKNTDSTVNDIIEEEKLSHAKSEGDIESHSDNKAYHSDNTNDNLINTKETDELKECNISKSIEVAIENDQLKEISNENDNKENKINVAKSPSDNKMCTQVSSKCEEFDTSESIEAATVNNETKNNENVKNKESKINLAKSTGNQIHTEEHMIKEVESDNPHSIEIDKGTEQQAKKKKMD